MFVHLVQYLLNNDNRNVAFEEELDRFLNVSRFVYHYPPSFFSICGALNEIDHMNESFTRVSYGYYQYMTYIIQRSDKMLSVLNTHVVILQLINMDNVPDNMRIPYASLVNKWLFFMETFIPSLGYFLMNLENEMGYIVPFHAETIRARLINLRNLIAMGLPVVNRVSVMGLLHERTLTVLCFNLQTDALNNALDNLCPIKQALVLGSNVMRRSMEFVA